ncbi:MAG: hypothetical protein AAB401_05480 [Acidobacteriota bacterium]
MQLLAGELRREKRKFSTHPSVLTLIGMTSVLQFLYEFRNAQPGQLIEKLFLRDFRSRSFNAHLFDHFHYQRWFSVELSAEKFIRVHRDDSKN